MNGEWRAIPGYPGVFAFVRDGRIQQYRFAGLDNNWQQNKDGSWSPAVPVKASWSWMPNWLRKLLKLPRA